MGLDVNRVQTVRQRLATVPVENDEIDFTRARSAQGSLSKETRMVCAIRGDEALLRGTAHVTAPRIQPSAPASSSDSNG